MDVKWLLAAAGVVCACTVPDPSYIEPGEASEAGAGDTQADSDTSPSESSSTVTSEADDSSEDGDEVTTDAGDGDGDGELESDAGGDGDGDGDSPFQQTSRDCADAQLDVVMDDVQAIFNLHCIECHSPPSTPMGLDLTPGNAWATLVNQSASNCDKVRIVPDDPAASYMLDKLEDIDLCSGQPMPKNRQPLTLEERNTIQSWICAGAPAD